MPKPKYGQRKARKPEQEVGKASTSSKMPARSNKGGAVRGQARAAQVQAMNASKALAKPDAAKKRSRASTSTERAKARNRREVYASLTGSSNKPAASSAPAKSSSAPGNPGPGDVFGSFRKIADTFWNTR